MNPMRKKLTLVLILAITLSTISATQYVRADVGFSYEIVHPSDADIRYIGSDNAADGLLLIHLIVLFRWSLGNGVVIKPRRILQHLVL